MDVPPVDAAPVHRQPVHATRRIVRTLLAVLVALAIVLPVAWRTALAHEVPQHVAVRAYVAPLSDRVRMLVQIPMDAVRDVDFPLIGQDALDVPRAAPFLADAARLWVADGIRLRDGARDLGTAQVVAVRATLPGDRAFASYADAMRAIREAPLDTTVNVPHGQLRLEVWLEWPTATPVGDLVIEPQWAHLGVRTSTVLNLVRADGGVRPYSFDGNPGAVRLDPRWWHAAARFVGEGMHHMLGGLDHLLFVLCLVLPFRQLRPLIGLVTAFTVGHSFTLLASAFGWTPDAGWFAPLVEVLIALSIVFMAVENMLGASLERRWRFAFAFGLVHGFGFSAALQDALQLAGSHVLVSLAAFNLGVELAQVLVLVLTVPLLDQLFRRAVPERAGVLVASAFVAHEAWHWMRERAADLSAQPFVLPALDAALALTVARWLTAALLMLGVWWLMESLIRRWATPHSASTTRVSGSPVPGVAATLACVVLASSFAASNLHAQTAPRSTMAGVYTADQATKGREVFNGMCLGCHTTASHQGTAFQLKWFGRPLFDLYDYLSQAMPKTAPGSLTEDEYVWVTAYILRLNGMPAGKVELNAEPKWLKTVRVDSVSVRNGASVQLPTKHAPLFARHP
ncbi:HupE/UreJ family protein [Gemmatimonas sp. UBA7669]|uniref:HupE/UreJ family protein n=1 Tax=Gemmatimonas sp. UBA7669 TaxID=1946568 RepID=UPI0025C52E75|nr:HupE/UreJ family protein [Gemmatimonas sp. UBA7669]